MDVAWLVEHFGMDMLPVESTYFVRTYTSATTAADGSAAGSAIIGLFAREPRSRSLFHTVECDELWHFYGGDPFRLVLLYSDGTSEGIVLGPDLAAGHRVQQLVPAGVWQAGELLATHPSRRVDIERLSVPADQPRGLPPEEPSGALGGIPRGVS